MSLRLLICYPRVWYSRWRTYNVVLCSSQGPALTKSHRSSLTSPGPTLLHHAKAPLGRPRGPAGAHQPQAPERAIAGPLRHAPRTWEIPKLENSGDYEVSFRNTGWLPTPTPPSCSLAERDRPPAYGGTLLCKRQHPLPVRHCETVGGFPPAWKLTSPKSERMLSVD